MIRVILLLVLIGFFIDTISVYLYTHGKNSSGWTNTFTLIETLFISYFFRTILHSAFAKKLVAFLALGASIIWGILFLQKGTTSYLELCINIEFIIILLLSICYFYEQIKKPDSPFIYIQPRFWVVVGYLLYSAGTFFLFLYLSSLNKDDQKKYFILNSIFLIVKTIFLSIAVIMKKQKSVPQKFQLH